MRTSSLSAAGIFLAICLTTTWAMQSKFPCPGDKAALGKNNCKVVKLPPGLCSDCPLKAPASNGAFKDCAAIYDSTTSQCKATMNKYVQANPCDGVRASAMQKINAGNGGNFEKNAINYFLYSVCEQCCDCIPMGASKTANSGQWVTYRGTLLYHFLLSFSIFANLFISA